MLHDYEKNHPCGRERFLRPIVDGTFCRRRLGGGGLDTLWDGFFGVRIGGASESQGIWRRSSERRYGVVEGSDGAVEWA